uniref:DUF148 domain-containing protein n=1 Tax=Panagrolaimus sp. PS1159 TaxID=55785 RepID=A0AC35G755_9BILA
MMKIILIFFGYFIFNLNCDEEVPNFLVGLDQNKTMEFYAIESGLNLSKNDIIRKKAEWAANLPPENKIAFEKFNNLANQAKFQHLNTVPNNLLSPEANAVKEKIQNVLNDRTLSRTGEVAAIENILSQSSPSIDAELIDTPTNSGGDNIQHQMIQNSDNTFNQQPPRPRPQQQQKTFSSIGDIFRASGSFPPQKASIFQG